MNRLKARALKAGDAVFDSEGTAFVFMGLDKDEDIVVRCRAAINGRIVLDRTACTLCVLHVDGENRRNPVHWEDVTLLITLGRQIYDMMYPTSQRGDVWIQEDFEETMIQTLAALRFFAEDVETLTWQHLVDNGDDRFHTEVARAEEQDRAEGQDRPPCRQCGCIIKPGEDSLMKGGYPYHTKCWDAL